MSAAAAQKPGSPESNAATASRLKLFGVLAGVLCLAFAKPLFAWLRLGLDSDFYSCMLLVPVVSV